MNDAMKLAIFLPNWIGDVVMATPAIRALRRRFAEARLIAVGKPYVQGVLDGLTWLDEFVPLDSRGSLAQRWLSVAGRLKVRGIDLAVLFPNSFRSALVAWLASCERRIGFDRYGRGILLTDCLAPVRDEHGQLTPAPIIDDYNRLAEAAGCADPGHRLELATTAEDEQGADAVWNLFRLHAYVEVVCLNPGAAFGAAKHWPAEHFAHLARQLRRERGCGVLVLCGPGERQLAQQIVALAESDGVHSLAEQALSLGLTKALVRRADLLVTTDSGPRHFAAAFDRPVVTLFGPTHIAWTETYFARAVHLQKKVECGPCQLRVCPLDHRCMIDLKPREVIDAIRQLLSGTRREAC